MMEIGIIPDERLANIPKKHRASHEFCFHIHDLMVRLLANTEAKRAHHVRVEFSDKEEAAKFTNDVHILDFLAQTGRDDVERRAVINHIGIALFSDILHFLHDGLIALEKRKFTVAYTLLRKPLKENLFLAAWICADEGEFFRRLKNDPRSSFDQALLTPEKKVEILQGAIDQCRGMNFANAQKIYNLIYDRKMISGFAPLFDKAAHIVTKNVHIATEDYNLNFIFKNPLDDDVYQNVYADLAMILLFLHLIQIEIYSRMELSQDKYLTWLMVTSIGAYEALFVKGGRNMTRFVNSSLSEFFQCQSCGLPMRLTKQTAARFFVAEMIECRHCGVLQHFPLSWLISKVSVDIR